MTTQAVVAFPSPAQKAPSRPAWSRATRVGFRMALIYFVCFIFFTRNGTLFDLFPVVGNWIDKGLMWLPDRASAWLGVHLFHLTGTAAQWHPTGSGDTALNWVELGLYAVLSLLGGMLWSQISEGRREPRTEYKTLFAWLRFLLRLTCASFMLLYGFAKVFPLQMAPISIGILNEPVGNMSPMTMLWALVGLHPLYEIICGLAEVIGGVLLMFRRTALLGALVSAFVIANVVLYNFFFDVPVKIFAANLLLALLFLALPDVHALFDFFWRHKPSAPDAVWFPPAGRRPVRLTLRIVEIVFTFGFLLTIPIFTGLAWRQAVTAARTPSPLLGAWKLDASHPASGAFVTNDGAPAADLYIDTVQRAFTRSTDGELWRTRLAIDAKNHTVTVVPYGRGPVRYSWQMADADHLVLTSLPPSTARKKAAADSAKFEPQTLAFTRIPIPSHYFLLDRGFHFVNQWGYER